MKLRWLVLFAVRKGCVRVSFIVWLAEERSVPCVCSEIYHRVDHPMNGYLNNFVAARNIRASASPGELALVIPCCRPDQFSRSFLPAAVCL